MAWASMVTVGVVVRPQGNRGEVVVDPATDFGSERFKPGAVVYRDGAAGPEAIRVATSREFRGRWIVGFEGVSTIDDAERWRGRELRIPPADLRPLLPGGYYVHDLVGCRVWTVGGVDVGVVERVDVGPGAPWLVLSGSAEVLVPFVDSICRDVDVSAKRIVIDPPAGLIELNQP